MEPKEDPEVKQEEGERPALAEPTPPRSNVLRLRPRSEILRSYEGMEADVAASLRNLELGDNKKEGDEEDDDVFHDEVREPVLLSNPNAEIRDGGSPDLVSPERGTETQQFETFSGVVAAATAEVANQAQSALANIARNLREVDGRHLRCLEREISLKRREAELSAREKEMEAREVELRSMPRDIPVSWSASHFRGGKRGPGFARGAAGGLRMPRGVTPLVNKKGKKSLVFVDDFSMPIDEAGYIVEVTPSNVPRVDLGMEPVNWTTPRRKNFPLPSQEQRWKVVIYNWNVAMIRRRS